MLENSHLMPSFPVAWMAENHHGRCIMANRAAEAQIASSERLELRFVVTQKTPWHKEPFDNSICDLHPPFFH
jgi:hypothetical protein